MKKTDLKTDGTKYVVVPSGSLGNYIAEHSKAKAVLLDLASPDAPQSSRYDREPCPIKARLLAAHGHLKRGDVIHISARRVLMTVEQHEAAVVAAAESAQRVAETQEANLAKYEPLAAELNAKQRKLGLVASYDRTRPMLEYRADPYRGGHLTYTDYAPNPEAYLALLDEMLALRATGEVS